MSAITFKHKGDFKKADTFFKVMAEMPYLNPLDKYGKMGVDALAAATPVDTGTTAKCWTYRIEHGRGYVSIVWENANIVKGVPIALILQYGHGTNNGGYVRGRNYINPALAPVFDKLAEEAWKEVKDT